MKQKALVITLVLVLVLSALCLCACDDKNNDNNTPADKANLEDFAGRLASYVIDHTDEIADGDDYQMNFELPEDAADLVPTYNWLLASGGYLNGAYQGLYLVCYDNAEEAESAIPSLKEYIGGGEKGTIIQNNNIVFWDSGNGSYYETIKNYENKINDLLPSYVIDRYKYHVTQLLSEDSIGSMGYVSCVFSKGMIYSSSSIYSDNSGYSRGFNYLTDDATEKDIAWFKEQYDNIGDLSENETVVKVNDNFGYYEEFHEYDDEEE